MMEGKGQERRRRSVGISTGGAGDSSWRGGHGGSGGRGLSESRSLLHFCLSLYTASSVTFYPLSFAGMLHHSQI